MCTQSGKPTFSGQYSVELGVQYALASQSVINDKHLPLFSSSGSLFASLFIFPLSSHIKNTIFWDKKHKIWIFIGFNDCAVGRVGTMICFHRCVTRFRLRRDLAGCEGTGGGVGGVMYCLAPLQDTLCPGLRRFTLDTYRLRRPCQRAALMDPSAVKQIILENHSRNLNLTLFSTSPPAPISFSSKKAFQ